MESQLPDSEVITPQVEVQIGIGATEKAVECLTDAGLETIRSEPMSAFKIIDAMSQDRRFPFNRFAAPLQKISIVVTDGSELEPYNFGILGGKFERAGVCTLIKNTSEEREAGILVSATQDGKFIGNDNVHEILVHELQHAHDMLFSPDSTTEDTQHYRSKIKRVNAELFGAAVLYCAGNAAFAEYRHDVTGSLTISTTLGAIAGLAVWGVAKNSKSAKGRVFRSYYKESPLEVRARETANEASRYPRAIHISR